VNFLLLVLTILICSVAYPLALWAIALTALPDKANGSLHTVNERTIGSELIAQSFSGEEYFWPRPSAASYNAAAAGASNWGANNPKLRDRVAEQIGPIIQYRQGSESAKSGSPQQDMERWFAAKSDRAAELAANYPIAAAQKDAPMPAAYFDMWLQDPVNRSKVADVEPVPSDMVTTSGSGLDPHITLRNALSVYQLDRVAKKRAASPDGVEKLKLEIARLVREKSFTPLSGLIGEPLVNVLELNIALDAKFPFSTAR
jgi:K+-transporting ATPase c subunit